MTALVLALTTVVLTMVVVPSGVSAEVPTAIDIEAPKPGLYLAPVGAMFAGDGNKRSVDGLDIESVHSYGDHELVTIEHPENLTPERLSQLTLIENADIVSYRSWMGSSDVTDFGDGADGYYTVSFQGPISQAWTSHLESLGMTIVDTAAPFSVVVRANGTQLQESLSLQLSSGRAAVRGFNKVPNAARVSPDILAVAEGAMTIDSIQGLRRSEYGETIMIAVPYADANPRRVMRQMRRIVEPASLTAGFGYENAFVMTPAQAWQALNEIEGLAWLELLHERRLMNNLAAKSSVQAVEDVWNLGYTGAGVAVNHNDGGIDLNGVGGQTAFPAGTVTATAGNHTATDNSHGTHTAGSVAGRAISTAPPTNTNSCGDQTTPLASARGMAYGATLNSNNLFDPGSTGKTTENDMMKWGQDNASQITTNSWGYQNSYTYSSQSVTIDRAVRDADTTEAGNQALCAIFAAGNDGSGAGTVGMPGNGKNVLTVGASYNVRCGSYTSGVPSTLGGKLGQVVDFSGRGPSQNRIKPDIVATGANVLSFASDDSLADHTWDQTWTGANYELMPGTSMACPIVAGATAVFYQYYKATQGGAFPSPALAKASMINGAVAMTGGTTTYTYENTSTGTYAQGWGRLNLKNSVQGPTGGTIGFVEQGTGLTTGGSNSRNITVNSSTVPLKITVVWTDPQGTAGSSAPLVNNLDLIVTAPNGTVYRGNRFTGVWSTANPGATTDTANNVENVFVQSPATGVWTIEVRGTNVPTNVSGMTGQDFAMAWSGNATAGGSGCSYSISPTTVSPAAGATTGTVSVTVGTGCNWTAVSNAAWLTVTSGASGTGNGSVGYSVLANSGVARTGTLTIAGQTFTVNQAAGSSCSYSISPSSSSPGAGATTGSVTVTAGAGCAWTATSNAAWLTITSGASGSGNGSTGYSVAANTGTARTGTLTVAGSTFTVNQAAAATGATPIACGSSAAGALATTDGRSSVKGATFYADNYSFTPTASGTATITLNASPMDAWLVLKSSLTSTTALAQDDDSNGGTNSRITYSVTAGTTYYVEATSYTANATGSYTLALTCPTVATELVTNGGFDTGSMSPWVAATYSTVTTGAPQAGTYKAQMLGRGVTTSTNFYQTIAGFNGATKTLRFWLKMTSAEGTGTAYDFLYVRLKNSSGTTLSTMGTYDNRQKNTYAGWVQVTLTVPATAVANSRIAFDGTEDSSLQTTFFIDGVSIQ